MRNKPKLEPKPVGAPANRSGPIPDRKQMATICGCYSVDRLIRTPEEVLRGLFREPSLEINTEKRPRPIQSRSQACMSRTQKNAEDSLDGEVSAVGWLSEHVRDRRREGQELINLNDGEISIWANIELTQEQNNRVDIIDLLHAIQRVWDAAVILQPVNLYKFARTHIGSILSGNVKTVIQSFRWQSTRLLLEGKSKAGKLWKEFQLIHQTRVLSMYGEKRSNFVDSFQLAA